MIDESRSELYRVAFDEARRRIDVQSTTLENTRSRAGTLLAAAAVVAGLVARPVFEDGSEALTDGGTVGLICAAACFVGIALATVIIWWPADATDTLSASTIIDDYIEADPPADLPETYSNLARFVDRHADDLYKEVGGRLRLFSWAAAAFGVMVVVLPLVAWDAQA